MKNDKIKSIREQYRDLILERMLFSEDDLTPLEKETIEEVINISYSLFQEKMEEIKDLNDEVRKLKITNQNQKIYIDDIQSDQKNQR